MVDELMGGRGEVWEMIRVRVRGKGYRLELTGKSLWENGKIMGLKHLKIL